MFSLALPCCDATGKALLVLDHDLLPPEVEHDARHQVADGADVTKGGAAGEDVLVEILNAMQSRKRSAAWREKREREGGSKITSPPQRKPVPSFRIKTRIR